MTDLPLWKLGADTFEARERIDDAIETVEWLAERNNYQGLQKIQERLDEVSSRGKAA